MKKVLALTLAVLLIAGLFAGCSSATPGQGTVKTGLAVVTSIAKSTDAKADAAGLAEVDSTIVAVTVDKDGKIVKCIIDAAQTKVNFSADGKVTTPLTTAYQTKNELKDAYGMKKASGIGKEWYQEAAAFADYVVGKTVAQVKGIAVNDKGEPTGSDLTSSVTIGIGDFVKAIEKAVANAQDAGAKAGDKLGLGVDTSISGSKDAAGTTAGLAQAYSYYTVITTDASGKITSSVIDASQSNVNFDAIGKITSDKTVAPQTKNELGDKYGMKAKSGIGKEWYQEAAAFAKYVVGKTAADVKGIAVDDKGHATGSDLTSSVTVSIADFKATIEKAAANLK